MLTSVKSKLTLITFLTAVQHELGIRKTIFWSVTVYNKNVSSQCNMTALREPVQDKSLKLDTTCMVLPAFSAASSASLRFNLCSISSFCLCFSVFTGVITGESSTFETIFNKQNEWLINCWLTLTQLSFSYIMMRTCYFSMRWWWGLTLLCTRPTCTFSKNIGGSWIFLTSGAHL